MNGTIGRMNWRHPPLRRSKKRKGVSALTDMQRLKRDVQAYAETIGIDQIGFTTADPFLELKDRLYHHREKGYESGFEEKDIEKRAHPELTMPHAKSIVAIALAYPSRMKNAPRSKKGAYRGLMARVSWGEDYHRVLNRKLEQLERYIKETIPEARVESMVDTGVLSDRAVAERAGIGWSGKNSAMISEKLGSWIYLGEMITNLPFPPDTPVEDGCGDCNLCVDNCPTGALVQGGQLNAQRCIAFVTQRKDFIEDEFKEKIGNRLYGCDTCQQVCPKNRGIDFHTHEAFEPDPETAKPLLKPLLKMGKREFKERFGRTSGAWRGKKPIQRNAVLALGNFKDASAVSELTDVLKEDPRPELRGSAAWSLGKIGGTEAKTALDHALEHENHPQAKEEIQRAQAKMQHV